MAGKLLATSRRRIGQLAGQLQSPVGDQFHGLLLQLDDGSVTAGGLERLEQLELAAAAKHDYRQAASLQVMLKALRPMPTWTHEQCAPVGVDAQVDFFLHHGFVVVDSVLGAGQLGSARAAWTTAQVTAQRDWEARDKPDGYFDIPNLLELDDVFVDLIDSPALVPLVARLTGFDDPSDPDKSVIYGPVNGSTRASKMTGRVVPSGDAASYTWWHSDVSMPQARPLPATRQSDDIICKRSPSGGTSRSYILYIYMHRIVLLTFHCLTYITCRWANQTTWHAQLTVGSKW